MLGVGDQEGIAALPKLGPVVVWSWSVAEASRSAVAGRRARLCGGARRVSELLGDERDYSANGASRMAAAKAP
jgi:hypothetical protein